MDPSCVKSCTGFVITFTVVPSATLLKVKNVEAGFGCKVILFNN